MAKYKAIDKRVFKISNFYDDRMVDFPHKFRENDMPIAICKNTKLTTWSKITDEICSVFNITTRE
jgi:hypothetical protein